MRQSYTFTFFAVGLAFVLCLLLTAGAVLAALRALGRLAWPWVWAASPAWGAAALLGVVLLALAAWDLRQWLRARRA